MNRRTEPGARVCVRRAVAVSSFRDRHRCPVCDGTIPPGSGVWTRYEGMTLVFREAACRGRFERDPERYLRAPVEDAAEDAGSASESPASEWCCDR